MRCARFTTAGNFAYHTHCFFAVVVFGNVSRRPKHTHDVDFAKRFVDDEISILDGVLKFLYEYFQRTTFIATVTSFCDADGDGICDVIRARHAHSVDVDAELDGDQPKEGVYPSGTALDRVVEALLGEAAFDAPPLSELDDDAVESALGQGGVNVRKLILQIYHFDSRSFWCYPPSSIAK